MKHPVKFKHLLIVFFTHSVPRTKGHNEYGSDPRIYEHHLRSSGNKAWKKIQARTGFEQKDIFLSILRFQQRPSSSSCMSSPVTVIIIIFFLPQSPRFRLCFTQLVMFKYLLQCNINDSPPSPSFPSSSSCRSSGSSNLEDSSASTGSSSFPCCPVPSCSSSPSSLKFPSSPCKASLIFSSLCSSSVSGCPSVCSFLSSVEPVF